VITNLLEVLIIFHTCAVLLRNSIRCRVYLSLRWIVHSRIFALNKILLSGWQLLKERFLRRMFGRIKVSENWRKRYNKERMQLSGDLEMLVFVRINVNRMDSKRKVSQVFSNISKEED
jgi:hypothetical protein